MFWFQRFPPKSSKEFPQGSEGSSCWIRRRKVSEMSNSKFRLRSIQIGAAAWGSEGPDVAGDVSRNLSRSCG